MRRFRAWGCASASQPKSRSSGNETFLNLTVIRYAFSQLVHTAFVWHGHCFGDSQSEDVWILRVCGFWESTWWRVCYLTVSACHEELGEFLEIRVPKDDVDASAWRASDPCLVNGRGVRTTQINWKINLVRWSRVFRVWKFFLCEVCSDHVTGHARYGCGIMEASRRYTRNSKDGLVQDSRLDMVEATCAKSLGRSKETHERKMKMRYVTWQTICDRWLRHFYVVFVTCSACCTRSSYSFYAADDTILFPRVSNSSSFVTQSIRTQWKSDGQHPCVRQDIRDSAQTAATRAMLLVVRVSDTTNSCCKGVLMNMVLALSKKHTTWT